MSSPPPTPSNTLPKSLILRGSGNFKAHYDRGRRESVGPLTAWVLRSELPVCRLGLSTPRKLGPANVRNRLRRRLREAFRTTKPHHPPGIDMVLLLRPHQEKTTEEYKALLLKLFEKLSATRSA